MRYKTASAFRTALESHLGLRGPTLEGIMGSFEVSGDIIKVLVGGVSAFGDGQLA